VRVALCRNVSVPVALAKDNPQSAARGTALRTGSTTPRLARTLLVLVHGITYDRNYWDFPDPTGAPIAIRSSRRRCSAKFSTLSVDAIGAGSSSHPLSRSSRSTRTRYTVHPADPGRAQRRDPPRGGGRSTRVVLIGHSYGSWTTWFERRATTTSTRSCSRARRTASPR
jgi:pimeloyl-ACP methyl ester carboxylesterase